MDIDIVSVDKKIKDNFNEETKKINKYKEKLDYLEQILQNQHSLSISMRKNVQLEYDSLKEKITNIETGKSYNFYLMDTISLIDEYKKLLTQTKKIIFFGKNTNNSTSNKEIIKKYLQILKKYNFEYVLSCHDEDYSKKTKNTDKKENKENKEVVYTCNLCKSKKDFIKVDNTICICENCGNQIQTLGTTISYKDVNRVNLSTKYKYERRLHFRDCINQYQGKQNSTISDLVYNELEQQFELHGLLNKECKTNEEKFFQISKEHIMLFLKELGYTKHYEDVFLIHYKLTGKKPDNIYHLEQKLMDDFDVLSDLYDKKFKHTKRVDRKNFINTQYVLFQLLRKYKHPCKKEDFNILKTLDRKSFHDDICSELFSELGWNFTPFF